ncbi:hypothetical protein ACNAN0_00560 [Agrilactobacillus fermenti]|uniref:baeRF6 domain-containing protein n=1 Tax=Agrilactobacillus fermenti TaxID=2586909 RepID=UPI001E525C2D|nr:hypothetical protein [Agrilactobacillus fermenti]MCD2255580.1 hypothetical protein [Agrilactobacillus fermenti]
MALNDDLKRLVQDATRSEESPYVSIFMAIHPNDTNIQKDKSQFKNLVAEAEKKFTEQYPKKDWAVYQEEFDLISSERTLGRNGYEGMAVIASKDHVFRYFLTFEPGNSSFVSDNLYILPIIKDTHFSLDYDLLHIDREGFGLYQVRDGLLTTVELPETAPADFKEAIKDPLLVGDNAQIHPEHSTEDQWEETNRGRGGLDATVDDNLARYYKIVDQYVRQNYTLREHVPLVLLGNEEVQHVFRTISKNGMLEKHIHITKVPPKLDQASLMKLKAEIGSQFNQQTNDRVLQALDDARSGGREVSGTDNVIQAAIEGRIYQLLIRDDTFEPGIINLDMQVDTISSQATEHNLLNDIAVIVLAFGGRVDILADEDMPLGQSVIGLLRGKA